MDTVEVFLYLGSLMRLYLVKRVLILCYSHLLQIEAGAVL
jgi:hypothetical protein